MPRPSTLSPERREDFFNRLAVRYSDRTGLPVEECRALAEASNRGERTGHGRALLATAYGMLAEAMRPRHVSEGPKP